MASFYHRKLVLVTGGTGFVGSHIVDALLKKGAKVRVPIHKRPLWIKDKNIETVHADLTQKEDCITIVKGVDYVFHAAGPVGSAAVTPSSSMATITTTLILTARILHAAWVEGIERLLMFSSSTGYPAVDYPVKEDEMWNGLPHPSYFGYGWMRR